jgi:hypothetical protein
MADNYQLKAILSAVDKMSPVLKQVQAQAKTSSKYLLDMGKAAKTMGASFGLPVSVLSGLAAGFGIGAIKKAMDGFAESGETIHKGAIKAGMAVDQYQRMSYVFQQAGSSAEVMEMSMGQLNKRIAAAAMGKNKTLISLFKSMGIQMKDAGKWRNAADVLPKIADGFKKTDSAVRRAAIGNTLFGKQWAEIAPMLNEGKGGIDDMIARFGKLKGVLSKEDLDAGRAWGRLMRDVTVLTKGFQGSIAKELVPALTPLVERMIDWAAANKKLIGKDVKQMVQDFTKWLKTLDVTSSNLWPRFVSGLKAAASGFAWLVDKAGGMKNLLIGLVIYMNLNAISAMVGLMGATYRLAAAMAGPLMTALLTVGRFMLANPWVAAITALALGAVWIYRNWDKVKGWFSDFFGWVGKKWEQFLGWIDRVIDATRELLGLSKRVTAPDAATGPARPVVLPARGSVPLLPGPDVGGAGGGGGPARPFFGQGTLLGAPTEARVQGEIKIKFEDAPPGMRVVQAAASDKGVKIKPDVGYRSLGGPLSSVY